MIFKNCCKDRFYYLSESWCNFLLSTVHSSSNRVDACAIVDANLHCCDTCVHLCYNSLRARPHLRGFVRIRTLFDMFRLSVHSNMRIGSTEPV